MSLIQKVLCGPPRHSQKKKRYADNCSDISCDGIFIKQARLDYLIKIPSDLPRSPVLVFVHPRMALEQDVFP